ncbi:hypothetical protein H257_01311 [Aphanomyces astaci]|uniref:Uncharacterized protein n=1 Tax=Aphanomyces astaci TaxID=112090 RepID=W4H9E1_APHAT|nr:hypothetical protein H257_01311 [Aphanomyces astaci]ETV87899.1 hypothetical protein H257_01311 [Aphanomyces astaci]|eukprot:XP_009822762.1 hypothetical protein H257_01311 [Aphanomyces astaci]
MLLSRPCRVSCCRSLRVWVGWALHRLERSPAELGGRLGLWGWGQGEILLAQDQKDARRHVNRWQWASEMRQSWLYLLGLQLLLGLLSLACQQSIVASEQL